MTNQNATKFLANLAGVVHDSKKVPPALISGMRCACSQTVPHRSDGVGSARGIPKRRVDGAGTESCLPMSRCDRGSREVSGTPSARRRVLLIWKSARTVRERIRWCQAMGTPRRMYNRKIIIKSLRRWRQIDLAEACTISHGYSKLCVSSRNTERGPAGSFALPAADHLRLFRPGAEASAAACGSAGVLG